MKTFTTGSMNDFIADPKACNLCGPKRIDEICKAADRKIEHVKMLKEASVKKPRSGSQAEKLDEAIVDLGAAVNAAGHNWLKQHLKKSKIKLSEKLPADCRECHCYY